MRLLLPLLLLTPQDKPELVPGLLGEYYDIGEELNDFPNLKDMKPALRKIDPDVNFLQTNRQFANSGLIDHFFVRWTGVLRVAKAGRYMFYTESDDGSRLFLDGKLVVDNGGNHIPEEKSGEAQLAAGDHEIRIEYFENTGGACCRVKWASDDLKAEAVPARAFFHRKDAELDKP